jgi:tetratricopeptide (TPR) repeat protein
LAVDLLRLGEEDEGWQLANEVNASDGYNVVAHNLVTLRDALDDFRTLSADGFILRMEAREAELYGRRALDLLREAKRVVCEKYDVTLEDQIIVEIFPEQKDFAVRTFGMPGGAGFLGVCFGKVITANSPASQGTSPSNWEAVLWHEFCHVVTLHKSRNKMPRWLSEGISVYEERQANPSWGQSMTPVYQQMVLGDDLTPVSQLSGAFLRPESALHLQFAYYESSLVVEYLVNTYGLETVRGMLDDLAIGLPIEAVLLRHTGSLEKLDANFEQFARERAEAFAPEAEWDDPELEPPLDVGTLTAWVEMHPNNFPALQQLAELHIAQQNWEEAEKALLRLKDLYPEDTSGRGANRQLARVYREMGETQRERAVLEELAAVLADAPEVYLRLAELGSEVGQWDVVADNAHRMLAVNPLVAAPHRHLAAAADRLDRPAEAAQALRAMLVLDPVDPAELHYRLAEQLARSGQRDEARREVLRALEEAPRFRDAHRLLLSLVDDTERDGDQSEPAAPQAARAGVGTP